MKKIKKIIIWAMLSIMLQVSVLLYVDKVYLEFSPDFVVVSDDSKKEKEVKNEMENKVPDNATDVKFSDNGKYIAYTAEDGTKKVINTSSQVVSDLVTEDDGEILYYQWILDEDILMVVEKVYMSSWSSNVVVSTINIKNDNFQSKMGDRLCSYQEGMTIEGIACSNGTGTYYVGVNTGGYSSSIYRIDINNNVTPIAYYLTSIGNMAAVENYDILAYEDDTNKTFYYYTNGLSNQIYFDNSNNLQLIGVDDKKKIYVGETEGDKISKIIYGDYDSDPSTWKTITLEKPKDIKDIFITIEDEILINDNLEGKITNLTTNEEIEYEGMLQQVTSQYIVSYLDDKIIFTDLEDDKN